MLPAGGVPQTSCQGQAMYHLPNLLREDVLTITLSW